jgi:hypothetical protein
MMVEKLFMTDDQRVVPVVHFKDSAIKTLLYEEAIEQRAQLLQKRARGEPTAAPLLHFPAGVDRSWMMELAQERRVRVIQNRQWVMVWAEPKGKNDHGDAAKMNLLAYLKARPLLAAMHEMKVAQTEGTEN